ncbi:MAG: imidazolonepropionase [Bacteroidia bacterium]|nr:imidazolonepropionase [Bacteroidia bacterium]
MIKTKIIGPFVQLLTMDNIPLKGSVNDSQLEIIPNGGVVVCEGKIVKTGNFEQLCYEFRDQHTIIDRIDKDMVAIPGMVDPHTHICWAGSRAMDYSLRLAGKSYLEIAQSGGGIGDTVTKTRAATIAELESLLTERAIAHLNNGVTTIEVKSGYCLNTEGELKLLEVIGNVNKTIRVDLISTCLAAHIKPNDFEGKPSDYLESIVNELLPEIKKRTLSNRIDIYIDNGAFTVNEARVYLKHAKKMGFDLVIHGDQFTIGGSLLACELEALSVDHLEAVNDLEIKLLSASNVISIVLPGASLGLGCGFAPARKLLDAGCSLAIGSDWNPGSAPMGDLLLQTAILGIFEKMTMAESLAGITFRAARALDLTDRGILKERFLADLAGFPTSDYREILYNQGSLKPSAVWKKGENVRVRI